MSQLYVDNIRNRTGGPIGIPTGAVVTGVLTATTGNITGNMTVGGVLTYEDVTNIDSVGVITARQGVVVVGGGITAVGVVTATKFIGDGSELSGVVSGIEVKSNGTSVGTSLTAINFVHTGDITTGSGGITTVTT